MKVLVFFLLCAISTNVFAQPAESYVVTISGDTNYLYKDVEIDLHSHPQAVLYKNEQNERKRILSTELKSLLIVRVDTRKNLVNSYHYDVKNIVTKKGFCTHFVTVFYAQDDFKIFETPYCPNESYLTLYIENEEGNLVGISSSNYKQIIDTYFWEYLTFLKLKKRSYSAGKLWQAITDLKESRLEKW